MRNGECENKFLPFSSFFLRERGKFSLIFQRSQWKVQQQLCDEKPKCLSWIWASERKFTDVAWELLWLGKLLQITDEISPTMMKILWESETCVLWKIRLDFPVKIFLFYRYFKKENNVMESGIISIKEKTVEGLINVKNIIITGLFSWNFYLDSWIPKHFII